MGSHITENKSNLPFPFGGISIRVKGFSLPKWRLSLLVNGWMQTLLTWERIWCKCSTEFWDGWCNQKVWRIVCFASSVVEGTALHCFQFLYLGYLLQDSPPPLSGWRIIWHFWFSWPLLFTLFSSIKLQMANQMHIAWSHMPLLLLSCLLACQDWLNLDSRLISYISSVEV